jgi:1L-myo-inositol 1-phosphate cytidylyltransferase
MTGSATSDRTGLILAAGYGSRHAVGNQVELKPLLPVAGRPLILRAIDGLEQAGCGRVVIVLGYEASRIHAAITENYDAGVELDFVVNPRFDLQNGVSVLAARDRLPDDFVLAMADHVFEPSVMALVSRHRCPPDGATLVVDYKLDSILDMDDATKVIVLDGRVMRIGKALEEYNAVDCGVFLAGHALLAAIEDVRQKKGDASLSDGVQKLSAEARMEALDLGPGRWQDVDNAEMMIAAELLLGVA